MLILQRAVLRLPPQHATIAVNPAAKHAFVITFDNGRIKCFALPTNEIEQAAAPAFVRADCAIEIEPL